MSEVFFLEVNQLRRLVDVSETLNKLLRIIIDELDELLSHLHQGIANLLLPVLHNARILAVGADTVHGELADVVEVAHVLFGLLADGGQPLLVHQTLVAEVLLAQTRKVLGVQVVLLAEKPHCRSI